MKDGIECGKCKLLGEAAPCDECYNNFRLQKGFTIIPFPELLPKYKMSDSALASCMAFDAQKQYQMGVDTYDENFGAICVISRKEINGVMVCEYLNRIHKEDFEQEVKRISQYYNIPEDKILKERD